MSSHPLRPAELQWDTITPTFIDMEADTPRTKKHQRPHYLQVMAMGSRLISADYRVPQSQPEQWLTFHHTLPPTSLILQLWFTWVAQFLLLLPAQLVASMESLGERCNLRHCTHSGMVCSQTISCPQHTHTQHTHIQRLSSQTTTTPNTHPFTSRQGLGICADWEDLENLALNESSIGFTL